MFLKYLKAPIRNITSTGSPKIELSLSSPLSLSLSPSLPPVFCFKVIPFLSLVLSLSFFPSFSLFSIIFQRSTNNSNFFFLSLSAVSHRQVFFWVAIRANYKTTAKCLNFSMFSNPFLSPLFLPLKLFLNIKNLHHFLQS